MNVTSPYGIIVNFFFLIWCRDWWYYIPCLDYCVTMSVIGTQRFFVVCLVCYPVTEPLPKSQRRRQADLI